MAVSHENPKTVAILHGKTVRRRLTLSSTLAEKQKDLLRRTRMALKFYAKKSEFCRSTEGTRAFVVKGNRGNNFLRAIFTTEKDCRGKIDWVLYVP